MSRETDVCTWQPVFNGERYEIGHERPFTLPPDFVCECFHCHNFRENTRLAEDKMDLAAAKKAMKEPSIPWETVKAKLGLDGRAPVGKSEEGTGDARGKRLEDSGGAASAPDPSRVEDSHAKLAAEMRAEAERAFSWTRGDGGRQIDVHPNYVEELASVIEEQAARVEALGSIGLVREGLRDVAQASARSGENVQSAQGRVEEKKARMAQLYADARQILKELRAQVRHGIDAAQVSSIADGLERALVESEKESGT